MRFCVLILAPLLLAPGAAIALERFSPYSQFAQAQIRGTGPERGPDVIYLPTPQEVVEDMLRLANVRRGDVLYDLGSGDGRIAVTAARLYGIRAVGIDIDPERIQEANENARRHGVEKLVTFRQQDLFTSDFREATVVTLYLLPDLNVKLRPRLMAQLRPGSRVVSHQFEMGNWKPAKKLESNGRTVYFWVIPEKKGAR